MKTPGKNSLEIISVAKVLAREVHWLWKPYIPLGKLTLLEGDPESGKTFLALAISAAITKGQPVWADVLLADTPPATEPRNVLYISAEDDVADTLKPRFTKQEGDESRFFAARIRLPDQGQPAVGTFNLSDVEEFGRVISQVKPALVVIDPLQAFLGAGVDMHRANEVRPVLTGVARIAETQMCAVLLIRHLNKSVQQKAAYRGLGSMDFAAAARSILLAGKHPEDRNRFALVHAKSSLARNGPALGYRLGEFGLEWTGPEELAADELVGVLNRNTPTTSLETAIEFLQESLKAGPKAATEAEAEAVAKGIALRTLERARRILQVKGRPSQFQGPWQWSLPDQSPASNLAVSGEGLQPAS